jgi:hypothetical protein
MFKSVFFSTSFFVNLNDISKFFYSIIVECFSIITKEKTMTIIKRFSLDKISSFDDIINKLLKFCAKTMIKLLISLFDVCIEQTYHLKEFKSINTITLKKTRKSDYITSKTYRLIILLNIMKKIMKSIMSRKISFLTKIHRLLLESYMRCRKKKFIDIILELLTKQMHTIWERDIDKIAILLNLNVIEVFDMMSHDRLIHDLRKRKISKWIISWVINFLKKRSITLTINRRRIAFFSIQIKISQNFSLSLIFYFFYNANLLKMCDRLKINTSSLEYVDDVNILTYEKSIEDNCRALKRMRRLCEKWATRHEFVFASTKYKLIHFIRNLKKFNMTTIINIDTNIIQSKTDIRVLRVQINFKLKWESHVKKIQKKIIR